MMQMHWRDMNKEGRKSAMGSKARAKSGMLFYQPAPEIPALDSFCIKKDGLWYVYSLLYGRGIGVAVSPDLVSYEDRGLAIKHDPGTWEGGTVYSGDVFLWKDKYYMLYSASGPRSINGIGLAESEDLLTWEKYPENPVLIYPCARWYEGTTEDAVRGGISCRDVSVISDASIDDWIYCCFTASTGRGDYYRRGCIGLARSRNLRDWEYLPPLFAPGLYSAMEVPRVFRLAGKWFLIWLTCPWYGFRTDEDLGQRAYNWDETMIHYAIADNPLGPYRMPEDPTLFRGSFSPDVIGPVEEEGQVMLTCAMNKQQGEESRGRSWGGIIPAMPVRLAEGKSDKLEVCFPDRLRRYFSESLAVLDQLRTNTQEEQTNDVAKEGNNISFDFTSLRLVELSEVTGCDLIVELDCRVEKGRVGLVTRYDPESRDGCGMLVDPHRRELQFAELAPMYAKGMILKVLERHKITSQIAPSFKLSVISSRDYQLVFVDGVLAGTYSFARREAGAVSLIMENATGHCFVAGIHPTLRTSFLAFPGFSQIL